MTSRIQYQGGLRTECTHIFSGTRILTDAPLDNHGKAQAFSPTDLCATSLAACMLTVMGIKAEQSGMKLEGSEAELVKVMASDPRRISAIHIRMHLRGQSFTQKEKDILERTALSCPVYHSLHPDMEKKVEFLYD